MILDEFSAGRVAELFRAFSDASRVRILSALAEHEYNVTELAAAVGITESGISHHLRGLRQMQLVQTHREGKEVYYRIEDEHILALFQQGVNHILNGRTTSFPNLPGHLDPLSLYWQSGLSGYYANYQPIPGRLHRIIF